VLGYDQPILGYNSNRWNLVKGSLIECIRDGYENFFALIFIHLFWLWNCIDFIFWMTVCAAVDYTCNLTATVLFWFIEQIIGPNITVDTAFTVLFWLYHHLC
jgi:hypothetical protein